MAPCLLHLIKYIIASEIERPASSPLQKTAAALRARIGIYPRLRLGHFPTPLEPLSRLTVTLGGPKLWVKRDDQTGLGQGGNKVRALEFILPQAQAANADILVTAGVAQSNSVRQVAAAAAKLGLDCHFALYTGRVDGLDPDYEATGNILLDHLFGATCDTFEWTDDRDAVLRLLADRLRAKGRRPFVVPYGCANWLGAMGYLNAASEIQEQMANAGAKLTHVVHATGTGGTQAGLVVGFAAMGLDVQVIGIDVDADPQGVRRRVSARLHELAPHVGFEPEALEDRIIVETSFSAGAYGKADASTLEAIGMAARLEALTVDPVYSGKAFAGLVDLVRTCRFRPDDNVVFLHTGGGPAIYAYRSLFGFGAAKSRL